MKIKAGEKWKEFTLQTSKYALRYAVSSLEPFKFELLKDKRIVASFLGYKVDYNRYIRFVVSNPMAIFELPSYDRAAVDHALYLLNSDITTEIVS